MRKQAAKEAIMAMPDTVPALSEEEEAEATKKAQEFEKEADEHRGNLVLKVGQQGRPEECRSLYEGMTRRRVQKKTNTTSNFQSLKHVETPYEAFVGTL